MGATSDFQLEEADDERRELEAEFARNRPDLIAKGWDLEMWEAYMHSSEKDD